MYSYSHYTPWTDRHNEFPNERGQLREQIHLATGRSRKYYSSREILCLSLSLATCLIVFTRITPTRFAQFEFAVSIVVKNATAFSLTMLVAMFASGNKIAKLTVVMELWKEQFVRARARA